MNRLTIIKDDNAVGIDGVFYQIDCSKLPPNFHALQWNGIVGEIEWTGSPKPQNTTIENINDYLGYVTEWNKRDAEARAAQEQASSDEQLE